MRIDTVLIVRRLAVREDTLLVDSLDSCTASFCEIVSASCDALSCSFSVADWIYTKKVDTKQDFILHFSKHKGGMVSMTHRPYDEDFKNPSSPSIKMEKRNHNSQRNMAFPFLPLESGFAFIPRSKLSMAIL